MVCVLVEISSDMPSLDHGLKTRPEGMERAIAEMALAIEGEGVRELWSEAWTTRCPLVRPTSSGAVGRFTGVSLTVASAAVVRQY